MKRFIYLLFMSISLPLFSQTVVKPLIPIKDHSFAIFVDDETWRQCKLEIMNYKSVLENESLPVFVYAKTWQRPEEIKQQICELYKKKKLEGVVFMGDIPIPLIRKAQHLTSAFKMDETWPMIESSVPSDRFYDDLHLKFDFIKQDSIKSNFFYYNLTADSPQSIHCDIYSGRIKPVMDGSNPYHQISSYLKKAIEEHLSDNLLDQMVSYTGEGSYSNSLMAWEPELNNFKEQFQTLAEGKGQARFFRYNYSDYPKEAILNMMRDDNLDFMIFHSHGMPFRQYISANPVTNDFESHQEAIKLYLRDWAERQVKQKRDLNEIRESLINHQLDSTWVAGYEDKKVRDKDSILDLKTGILLDDISKTNPNPRFVILDACYNGDFREDDYVAGRYIFSNGHCVVAFGNTVNVLQDKQANEMLGLLGYGTRVGQWAQLTNILESHIIGDPTFRFKSCNSKYDGDEMFRKKESNNDLIQNLDSVPCDLQNLILYKLYRNNYTSLPDLLISHYKKSPYNMVRYSCFALALKVKGIRLNEMLQLAANDPYEFTRRIAINRCGAVADPSLLPTIIQASIDDRFAKRVTFNVSMALSVFDTLQIKKIADACFANSYLLNKEAAENRVLQSRNHYSYQEIVDTTYSVRRRMLYVPSLKNINDHTRLTDYIQIVENPNESKELRCGLLQSLAWYTFSYRKKEIMDACQRLLADKKLDSELKENALRTYNRLK